MGSLIVSVVGSTINMIKSVLFTCLVAAASADADAAYLGYGYPYAYGYAAHVPFGSSTGLDPITQGLDPVTQGVVPYYGLGYHYGKRSADAEADLMLLIWVMDIPMLLEPTVMPLMFLLDPALVLTQSPRDLTL